MTRRKKSHAMLYWRTRSDGAPRAWGDFREYAAQGGKREPLVVPGESRATTEAVLAQTLFAKRLAELAEARENAVTIPLRRKPGMGEIVKEHLAAKGREGVVTPGWVECGGVFLGRAVAYFGAERRLGSTRCKTWWTGSSISGRCAPRTIGR